MQLKWGGNCGRMPTKTYKRVKPDSLINNLKHKDKHKHSTSIRHPPKIKRIARIKSCCPKVSVSALRLVCYANHTCLAHHAGEASEKPRIMLRRLRFGTSVLLSSVAPVSGEVSLVRSHSVMAVRS